MSIKLFRILSLCSEKSFSLFSFGSILRSNNFPLKHKISEQKINTKVLSVASSCHYNGNSKHGKYVYRQMPTPRELFQQIPPAKARMKKPQGGGNFLCKCPRVHGGMVMDEIDTCIILKSDWLFPLHYLSLFVLVSVSLLSET